MRKPILLIGLVVAFLLLSLAPITIAAPAKDGVQMVVMVQQFDGSPVKGGQPAKDKPPAADKAWFSYDGIRWSDASLPIEYVVDLGGRSSSFLDGIIASFQVWENDPASNVDFDYVGAFSGTPSSLIGGGSMNGINEIAWAPLDAYPNAIAVTFIWYLDGQILEVDAAFKSSLPWAQAELTAGVDPDGVKGDSAAYDVQNIMTHEAGHWLMLEDLYQKPAAQQTMYGYGSLGELKKRSLESGDIAGLRTAYPA